MFLEEIASRIPGQTRSISAENPTGEKGKGALATLETGSAAAAARDLGVGWKVNPYVKIPAHEKQVLADFAGEGFITHIWMTLSGISRFLTLRIFWDGSQTPAVECPLGDFFAAATDRAYGQISSAAVCVNPWSGYNCYWRMPFKTGFRVELENLSDAEATIYYQIDFRLTQIPDDALRFYAQFRRVNPLPYKTEYVILDGVQGAGHYVGTYMFWGVNNNTWWGEGEIKFYIDGDEHPTVCGTGTEDYFGGSYNFEHREKHEYVPFTSPYSGFPMVYRGTGMYGQNSRFSLYRWHLPDPVLFEHDLKVTIQALGWRDGRRYLPLQDDISSVAYWYQQTPAAPFPPYPDKDALEII